jgi:hypothetical protein
MLEAGKREGRDEPVRAARPFLSFFVFSFIAVRRSKNRTKCSVSTLAHNGVEFVK